MTDNADSLRQALQNARIAYYQGDHSNTRYWARLAANLNPNLEEPWLWLAAVSSPKASIAYLEKALSINPQSKRAHDGMHWAIERLRSQPVVQLTTAIPVKPQAPAIAKRVAAKPAKRMGTSIYWWIFTLAILAIVTTALVSPAMGYYFNTFFYSPEALVASHNELVKASNTPTPTNTPTITPTPTNTPTPTPTDTPSPTPTPTDTPTDTPYPIDTPDLSEGEDLEYPTIRDGERWIDVDLSEQMVYAFEGDLIVNSFLVSTGTWRHPTVTGQFHIYVKYLYTDMAGPGYYLPDVPYTMYFYQGYGLHGTYWHSNFGTPMSHGCINLTIPDSEWLYYWAHVGTLVFIHD